MSEHRVRLILENDRVKAIEPALPEPLEETPLSEKEETDRPQGRRELSSISQ